MKAVHRAHVLAAALWFAADLDSGRPCPRRTGG